VHAWQNTVSANMQFAGFLLLRLFSASAFDFVSYAAGLTTLPFSRFFLASLIIDVPVSFLFFYVGGQALRYGIYFSAVFALLFMCGIVYAARFALRQRQNK